MENHENNSFSYTYSAYEQKEIKRIREKYVSKEPNKMEQLRMLDKSATKKAAKKSITIGVLSAVLMGTGMSCTMVWQGDLFVPSIIIGLIGIAGVSSAYPVYNKTLIKARKKIAPEILKLTDELMK